MTRVLHLLPHRGGGAETYLDALEAGADAAGETHERVALSEGRTPASLVTSLPLRAPGIVAAVRRADLVHAHGDAGAMLSAPLLAGRASVWSTHGLHLLRRAEGLRAPVVKAGVRAAIRATRATICTSEAERDDLRLIASPALQQRLRVVHNGIPIGLETSSEERASARSGLGLDASTTVVLFLGELDARKGVLDAANAARQAGRNGAQVVLLVAGDGPQAGAVQLLAGPHVVPLGHRDPRALLAAADIFTLPSSREGLSMALLEAMERGLAVVVSDGPGNPEAVGDAGVVVGVGDVDGLAAAFERLAGDLTERRRLGEAARRRAVEEFSVERFAAATREVYRDVLAG